MRGAKRLSVVSPRLVRELVESSQPAPCHRLVVVGRVSSKVDGQWAERIGVLDLSSRPKVLLDAWTLRDSLAELPPNSVGGWDVMFATSWRWAWGGTPFAVWSRGGWTAKVNARGCALIRRFGFEREHEIQHVRVDGLSWWLTQRVGLFTTAGKTIWVARRRELGPLIDPTYDDLDLAVDAGWASSLGAALANALEVPLEANL